MNALSFATLFYAEARIFRDAYPRSHVGAVRLRFEAAPCPAKRGCRPRDYAMAYYQGPRPVVVFALRVLDLPLESCVALIRHELAHVVDPTPEAREPEVRADAIAESVGGRAIRYDARQVQTICRGTPRPPHLPR